MVGEPAVPLLFFYSQVLPGRSVFCPQTALTSNYFLESLQVVQELVLDLNLEMAFLRGCDGNKESISRTQKRQHP